MTILSLTYSAPIRRSRVAKALDFELLETAGAQYDSGAFLEAMQTVFRHLFPDAPPTDLAHQFSFTQGSSRVTTWIDDNVFIASVPLVRLPTGGGAIAALRYILTRINASGQLFQARLRGDDVHLEFRERLSALHPQKLLEVLRRMPVLADQHDDWMVSQFGAVPLERGPITELDDDELARAEAVWRAHWQDVEELLKEAQRKRSMWFLNETTSFGLSRIRFAVPLGGSVLPRLLESAGTFNDSNVDASKRETTLAKCIKEMKAITSEELRKSLGHTEHAISPYAEGTPRRIVEFFGPGHYMESIETYRTSGQSMDAALPLIGTYYYLLATHSWPTEIEEELKNALAAVSGKPWRDAANAMFAHAKSLVEQYGDDEEEEGEDDEDDDNDDAEQEAGQ
jgi:hypothetical protein